MSVLTLNRQLWTRILAAAVALGLLLALLVGVGRWAEQREMADKTEALRHALEVHALGLRGTLERYSDLPAACAQHPDVLALLQQPRHVGLQRQVNRYLERLNQQVGASALYVIDRKGLTLAASNWRDPQGFVGQNYASRPYFQQALQGQRSMFYGVGLTTGQPGLFIAEPVNDPRTPVGVVVVKVGLEAVQTAWSGSPDPVVLSDERGVVFMSSVPQWLYLTRQPLTPDALQWIEAHNQYGRLPRPFSLLPWRYLSTPSADTGTPYQVVVRHDHAERALLALDAPVPALHGTLSVMTDLTDVARARRLAQTVAVLCVGVVLLGLLFWRQRERRLAEFRRHQHEAQMQHAARLASLGEMASTLAHELNQPLMALSNYGVAARRFAEQGQTQPLLEVVTEIQDQARRAADIVTRMRGFVRQRSPGRQTCDLRTVASAVLRLLRPELDARQVQVELSTDPDLSDICGDRLLLEQLLVNLLMNAMQACTGLPADRRRVLLTLQPAGMQTRLAVEDWGPGVPPEQADRLFEAFFTTKPQGLGLGLKICRSIAESHGGHLAHERPAHPGALFTLTLPSGPCPKRP